MSRLIKIFIAVFTMMILLFSLTIPSAALTYINENNPVSVQFTVPTDWEHQDSHFAGDLLKESYFYSGDTGEFILFGFCDLVKIGTIMKENGGSKNYRISRDDIALVAGVKADAIEIVDYHGIDYYRFIADSTPESPDAFPTTKLFCVINATMFTFQYGSSKNNFSHFADFEELINNVVYTIPSDSNHLEIYKSNRNDQHHEPFFNTAVIMIFYALPFFIYRYSKGESKSLN